MMPQVQQSPFEWPWQPLRPEVSLLSRVSLGISIIGGCSGDLDGLCESLVANTLECSLVILPVVLLERTPLLTFFLEELHVSGIIAVVVSGILEASRFKHITLLEARVDTVSHTVWNTVNFDLKWLGLCHLRNGIGNDLKPILNDPTQ